MQYFGLAAESSVAASLVRASFNDKKGNIIMELLVIYLYFKYTDENLYE